MGFSPRAARIPAHAMATGVLPDPPAVRLPTHSTRAFGRNGVAFLCFARTVAPYSAPSGDNIAAKIPSVFQNSGARMRTKQIFGKADGRRKGAAHSFRGSFGAGTPLACNRRVGKKFFY